MDKYGRKLKQDTAEKQLKRYYKLEHEEEDESEEDKTLEELEKELAEDEENILDEKLAAGYDPMRGRGEISSSESDDESDNEEDLESEPDELDSIQVRKQFLLFIIQAKNAVMFSVSKKGMKQVDWLLLTWIGIRLKLLIF